MPFRKWLDEQTKINKEKVRARLDRVMLGNYGDTSNEGGGIIALRFIKEGLRIYIANIDKIIVILLNGGDKGSKAQQNKDIQTAKEYLKDFKERI
ncbi:MAG: type II toxin-antitoxin system RelE/ParE family toxin [Rickettsiales bacterium]|nr:type II toxin-antitoxin system RelE/ParE family toxin [Rickettsiales bacterium]